MIGAADALFDGQGVHLCGHRGHSIDGTENSKSALRSARNMGATLCEIDIRLTADEEFVVFHDPTLDKASTGRGPTRDHTLKELRNVWHEARFSTNGAIAVNDGDSLICLAETLDFAAALDLGLVVEVKDRLTESRHVRKLVEIVKGSSLRDRVLFSSFDHCFLRDLKESHPHVLTFGIIHTRHVSPVRIALEAQIDVYSVDYPRFHSDDAAALRAEGIRVSTFLPRSVTTDRNWDKHVGGLNETIESVKEGTLDILGMDDVAWGRAFLECNKLAYRNSTHADVMA